MITGQMQWRRLYRHEPLEQRAWSLMTRGLRDLLLRQPEELDGVLLSRTESPVDDLLAAIGCHPRDYKVARKSVQELIDDGFLAYEDKALRIRNFERAQTAASSKVEAGRSGGKRSAEARRVRDGTAQPFASKQNDVCFEAEPEADIEADPSTASNVAPRSTEAREEKRREEKIQPGKATAKDLTGGARAEVPAAAAIPCPSDLRLTGNQRKTLETSLIPGWAIDALTTQYVVRYVGKPDELRTHAQWLSGLVTAICSDWNNSKTRPKKPEETPKERATRLTVEAFEQENGNAKTRGVSTGLLVIGSVSQPADAD